MESLANDRLIDKKSVLKQHSPQLDEDGVLYASTRLDNIDEGLRHLIAVNPLILPGSGKQSQVSEITKKINYANTHK